jgi:quercetin dioxygenase-like cupin family protein
MVILMAQPHAKSGQVVDLRPLGLKLHDAKTTALIKEKHFEAVRLIVHAGTDIPPHKVAGDIMLHCLEGEIVLGLSASEVILKSGDWLYLKGGELHSLKGIVDSSLLLTILFEK